MFCQFEPVQPWFINPSSLESLRENASYIKQHAANLKIKAEPIQHSLRKFDYPIDHNMSEAEVLRCLGIRSRLLNTESFQSQDQYRKSLELVDVILSTEKFFGPRPLSVGSARHALISSLQVKGIGQNSLNVAFDYPYQWGGLKSYNAFHGLYAELATAKRCELKPLPTAALLQYRNLRVDGATLVIHYRHINTYRLSAAWGPSLGKRERTMLADFVLNRFRTHDPAQILDHILRGIIRAFKQGVYHSTPSLINLTVTGDWIDAESLIVSPEETISEAFVELLQLEGKSEFVFFDSWIHHLYFQCRLMVDCYRSIFGDLGYELDHEFFRLIKTELDTLDLDFWFNLLSKHRSWRMLNFEGLSHSEMGQISYDLVKKFSPGGVHDYHTPFGKGLVHKFIENPAKTSYLDFLAKMSKVYLLLQDTSGGFSEATNRYERLKEIVDDHL